jgi:hypothetical protein
LLQLGFHKEDIEKMSPAEIYRKYTIAETLREAELEGMGEHK